MAQDWMDRFLYRRESEKIKQIADVQSIQMAKQASLPMLRALRDQVDKDLKKYANATGDRAIAFEVIPITEGFTVHREKFPFFHLEVTCENLGYLCFNFSLRKSQSADTERTDGQIILVAGPVVDESYYRMDGIDYSDPNLVSEKLLSPLFDALEQN